MTMDILFIGDLWCHGKEKFGVSAWESNFVETYKFLYPNSNIGEFNFDYQATVVGNDTSLNERLRFFIGSNNPKIIFLIIYEIPGSRKDLIDWETFEYIKSLNIPIFSIFGDLEHDIQCKILTLIYPYCEKIFYTALVPPGKRLNLENLVYTWVPKNPKFFNNVSHSILRDIEVSYLGSPKHDRMKLLNYLQRRGFKLFLGGGERSDNIDVVDYSNLLKRSKISISFSRAEGNHVVNARTFEIISCGSMLLEEAGIETPRFFRPYIDYVPYNGRRDLVKKLSYYLTNEQEREKISTSGSLRLQQYYSATRFWQDIIHYTIDKTALYSKEMTSFYWSNHFINRGCLNYNTSDYLRFKLSTRIFFYLINFIEERKILNNLLKLTYFVKQIPFRLCYKIYRLFYGRFK